MPGPPAVDSGDPAVVRKVVGGVFTRDPALDRVTLSLDRSWPLMPFFVGQLAAGRQI
jgi:hypothetical protein